jgi:hypothetical protein
MDLQKLYDDLQAALVALGLTEIEVELKPKSDGTVKLFVSARTQVLSK